MILRDNKITKSDIVDNEIVTDDVMQHLKLKRGLQKMDRTWMVFKIASDVIASIDADFIFLVLNKDSEEEDYEIGVSVHKNPKLGFQILRDHMSKNDARRVLRQLENKWKEAETLQFESKGDGYRKKYRKKKLI